MRAYKQLLNLLFVVLIPLTGHSFGDVQQKAHRLEIDLSSRELRALLQNQKNLKNLNPDSFGKDLNKNATGSVDQSLRVGERLLSWVDLINSKRPEGRKIRLTSPQTRRSYPITAPNHYSPRTIEANLNAAREQMPAVMRKILFNGAPLSSESPVSDEKFITSGRMIDRVYQTAARWTMLSPYKRQYAAQRALDIRGYYFLKTNNWSADALKNWAAIDPQIQLQIKEAFVGICINAFNSASYCQRTATAVNSGTAAARFYENYIGSAESVYTSFFDIQNARSDIRWKAGEASVAAIPFLDPVRDDVRHFIKDNIEAEYSWLGWGLKINFVNSNPAPFVVFIPGVTANVERIGGNKIEMDANKSLDEYEEQWTIRHEFGHVLGFPDCYHEFYDTTNEEFVNYQIDVTDLMCSRAGNMTQRIYDQLKAAYMR